MCINAIMYSSSTIFNEVGLGSVTAILGTVGIGAVNVIITIFAIMIIDKIDRKKLLIIGNIGMVASLIIMAGLIWTVGLDTDRKSTRLNSSHVAISYAVFCLKI